MTSSPGETGIKIKSEAEPVSRSVFSYIKISSHHTHCWEGAINFSGEGRVRLSFSFYSLVISLHNRLHTLVPKSSFVTDIYIYIYIYIYER